MSHDLKLKSYWNNRYETGAIWGEDACPSAVLAQECFREHAVRSVLVPGCGYGRNSLYLAQQGFDVVAYDISDIAIAYAAEQAGRQSLPLNYETGSLFDPAFLGEKQFDAIYLSNIIHLFMKEQREQVLDIMTSLLKPGGILAFSVVSIYDTGNYGKGEEVEPNTFMKHKDKLLHCYDEQELDDMLKPHYEFLKKCLHTQVEPDPSGELEELKLWFVAARRK
ncbi:class I SAM-dependent methyltransferase [Ectobacillus ponti]|uniref:Class I SAM-dependent methyltransferase n=1 Tax=Ectobacillus ponti TaxID=2961894 RepID=A0AA42BS22_9BACI|nr:class I SAM-dependent methyltransferase [Ectobacillus ponti]MCP8970119.1 class I SAM-dependent methyltransferase [Ectobacillus ponti]